LFLSATVTLVSFLPGEALHVCFFHAATGNVRNGSQIHNDDSYSNAALTFLLVPKGTFYGFSRVSVGSSHSDRTVHSIGSGSDPKLLMSSHVDKNSSATSSHFPAQLVSYPSSLA